MIYDSKTIITISKFSKFSSRIKSMVPIIKKFVIFLAKIKSWKFYQEFPIVNIILDKIFSFQKKL